MWHSPLMQPRWKCRSRYYIGSACSVPMVWPLYVHMLALISQIQFLERKWQRPNIPHVFHPYSSGNKLSTSLGTVQATFKDPESICHRMSGRYGYSNTDGNAAPSSVPNYPLQLAIYEWHPRVVTRARRRVISISTTSSTSQSHVSRAAISFDLKISPRVTP